MAVFAPIPSASVRTATTTKPGLRRSARRLNFRSRAVVSITPIMFMSAASPQAGPVWWRGLARKRTNRTCRLFHLPIGLLVTYTDFVKKSSLRRQATGLSPKTNLESICHAISSRHAHPSFTKYRSIHSKISFRISGNSTWAQSYNSIRQSASFPYSGNRESSPRPAAASTGPAARSRSNVPAARLIH